eukprot:TRINITY_DN5078_c0_g1::TRINITY_DN5078_c0_g1_i1::g.24763::m.24763 TRINITY_DN5078_c0_g1::TRINITY_DN5078_c0_g1_i1::g.24763  ORF type:complete len:128 (+),score=-3.57,PSS/PF03034.10/0.18 TRINITY_DN5078_c0_g1_i1:48-431(+)
MSFTVVVRTDACLPRFPTCSGDAWLFPSLMGAGVNGSAGTAITCSFISMKGFAWSMMPLNLLRGVLDVVHRCDIRDMFAALFANAFQVNDEVAENLDLGCHSRGVVVECGGGGEPVGANGCPSSTSR